MAIKDHFVQEHNKDKNRDEWLAYVCYQGKRLVDGGKKLAHTWFYVDSEGKRIEPDYEGGYYYNTKFSYQKRPTPGVIYRVAFCNAEGTQFFTDEVWKHNHMNHPDRRKMELDHRAASLKYQKIKDNKATKEELGTLTLDELKERLKKSSAKDRRIILAVIFDYLGIL